MWLEEAHQANDELKHGVERQSCEAKFHPWRQVATDCEHMRTRTPIGLCLLPVMFAFPSKI